MPRDSEGLWSELNRRRVVRVGIAYVVFGAALGGAAETFLPNLGAPDWVLTAVLIVIVVGFPVALVLAWVFDLTPGGVTRTPDLDVSVSDPPSPPAARSIAVLPFGNDDPEQVHLANGLAEELLNVLAQIQGLTVKSWGSSRAVAELGLSAAAAGQELRVAHVLEGSVRRAGQRLRITPRLTEVLTDRTVWSETFDETVSDIFDIQDRITSAVAGELELRLVGPSAVGARSTTNDQAHDLYLRGRETSQTGDESGLRAAIDYYRQALDLDPEYALAWAGISEAYMWLADGFVAPREAYPNAKEAALRALALDELPEARGVLGFSGISLDWDWEEYAAATERALAVNPNLAIAHIYRSWPLHLADRHDEALRSLDRAIELDPTSPFAPWLRSFSLVMVRRYEEAIDAARVVGELEPHFFYIESWGAAAHRARGEFDEAMAIYDAIARTHGEQPLPGLALTYAGMGKMDEAKRVLASLEGEAERRYVSAATIAWVHGAFGDRTSMLRWLDRAIIEGDIFVFMALGLEDLDPYRGDPEFHNRLARLGLLDYPWVQGSLG